MFKLSAGGMDYVLSDILPIACVRPSDCPKPSAAAFRNLVTCKLYSSRYSKRTWNKNQWRCMQSKWGPKSTYVMILVGNATVESWTQFLNHGRSQPYAYHSFHQILKYKNSSMQVLVLWQEADRSNHGSLFSGVSQSCLLIGPMHSRDDGSWKPKAKSKLGYDQVTGEFPLNVGQFPNYPRSPTSWTIHYFARTGWRRIWLIAEVEEVWNSSTNTYLGTSWVLAKRLEAVKLEWHCLSLESCLIMKQLHAIEHLILVLRTTASQEFDQDPIRCLT